MLLPGGHGSTANPGNHRSGQSSVVPGTDTWCETAPNGIRESQPWRTEVVRRPGSGRAVVTELGVDPTRGRSATVESVVSWLSLPRNGEHWPVGNDASTACQRSGCWRGLRPSWCGLTPFKPRYTPQVAVLLHRHDVATAAQGISRCACRSAAIGFGGSTDAADLVFEDVAALGLRLPAWRTRRYTAKPSVNVPRHEGQFGAD